VFNQKVQDKDVLLLPFELPGVLTAVGSVKAVGVIVGILLFTLRKVFILSTILLRLMMRILTLLR